MFTIINIISIIIGKFHAREWLWLHAGTIYLLPVSHLSGGRYSVVQDRSPRSGSRLFYGVVVVFPSGRGFLIVARKALRQSSSGEALATWPNKYNWFKLVMSVKKKLAWNRTCWYTLQSHPHWVLHPNSCKLIKLCLD